MNAVSLYVSTCRLVMHADKNDSTTWIDLYRLVPYLRQSLSCTVCSNLLLEPLTPADTGCQHHVCRVCKGGRKKLKPSCSWCKDYENYSENVHLRMLLQCYKKLCSYFRNTDVYKCILDNATSRDAGAISLVELISEGAGFTDEYTSTLGLSKSAYSILPCVYTNSSTQTSRPSTLTSEPTPLKTVSNGQETYSVLVADSGNKLTIKRKPAEFEDDQNTGSFSNDLDQIGNQNSFKKPVLQRNNTSSKSNTAKRKGCRCGNATPTPGKLTCCGQRCPCYVDGKACIECKCRGCRNPHRADGVKVRPHIPKWENVQIHYPETSEPFAPQKSQGGALELDGGDGATMNMNTVYSTQNLKVISLYSGDLTRISSSVPSSILIGDEITEQAISSEDNSDIDIDI